MAGTSLSSIKKKRLKSRSKRRQDGFKVLNAKPVIKNVDIEEIKASFAK